METIEVTDDGAVRTITMNRPESLNALNAQMRDDLTDAFLAAGDDETVKVVVLTGAGRAFSAGADLTEMGTATRSAHTLQDMVFAMIDLPQPWIAAVNGVGAGYGATVTGLADLTYVSQAARLKCPFSTLGLTAELGSTYNFPRRMGPQHAMWFLLSSEWMTGQELFDAGLAIEVVASDAFLPRVYEQAQKLAAMPRASLLATKRSVMDAHRESMKDSVRRENLRLSELGGGPANREALTAFAEQRDPDFGRL